MTDPDPPAIARPEVDPTVPRTDDPHGTTGHYSGQEHRRGDPAPDRVDAGGVAGGMAASPSTDREESGHGEDVPLEAGHRATVDQRTGAVHGSGAGAGGGQAGEDLDSDSGGSNTE